MVATLEDRVAQVLDLMDREWDPNDADSADAQAARAYNAALALVREVLFGEPAEALDKYDGTPVQSETAEESHWHDDDRTPAWGREMISQQRITLREIKRMSDSQAHLDQDVQALTAGISNVEAEIAALKNQPPAAQLDFTALDAAVARLAGDAPAPTPDPTPAS